jgi:predicted permease
VRRLGKSPGFVAIAVATLALGIGANTAIFGAVYGILLRPLLRPGAARNVAIWSRPVKFPSGFMESSPAAFAAIEKTRDIFVNVSFRQLWFKTLTGLKAPEVVEVAKVPGSYFALTGASPLFGRIFSQGEEEPGHNQVAVLSYSLWQRQFGGNRAILGRALQLDKTVYTVVGVMPAGYTPGGADLWLPASLRGVLSQGATTHDLAISARLRRGVSLRKAQAALDTISARLAAAHPKTEKGWRLVAVRYIEMEVGYVRTGLLLLFGAVGLVLLIACTNLSNLLLARGLARTKELAIRSALGATRGRIVRGMLTESILVSLAGGALGLVVGWWGIGILRAIAPADTPRLDKVGLSPAVFLFALCASIFAGVLSGLAPALRASRQDPNVGLKEGGQGSGYGAREGRRLRNLLVGAEIALCVVLLSGSLLVLRSFDRLLHVNFGFPTSHVLTFGVSVPSFKYPKTQQQQAMIERILAGLRSVPGVESAGAQVNPVLEGSGLSGKFSVESPSGATTAADQWTQVRYVSFDYFRTLGIPVLTGRQFAESETLAGAPVALVSQSFARQYFPHQNPVGGHLVDDSPRAGRAVVKIVGVVADLRDRDVARAPTPTVYLPLFREASTLWTWFFVRTAIPPTGLVKSVEARIWEIDKDLPIRDVLTLNQAISQDLHEPRFQAALFSSFAVLGLVLALVGIYGVIAYSVGRRIREMGVRMALGARPADVFRLVVWDAALPVAAGIVAGIAGSLGLTRYLRSLLYEVSPADPATLAAAIGLMLFVALIACLLPAWRASRADPAAVLRSE